MGLNCFYSSAMRLRCWILGHLGRSGAEEGDSVLCPAPHAPCAGPSTSDTSPGEMRGGCAVLCFVLRHPWVSGPSPHLGTQNQRRPLDLDGAPRAASGQADTGPV